MRLSNDARNRIVQRVVQLGDLPGRDVALDQPTPMEMFNQLLSVGVGRAAAERAVAEEIFRDDSDEPDEPGVRSRVTKMLRTQRRVAVEDELKLPAVHVRELFEEWFESSGFRPFQRGEFGSTWDVQPGLVGVARRLANRVGGTQLFKNISKLEVRVVGVPVDSCLARVKTTVERVHVDQAHEDFLRVVDYIRNGEQPTPLGGRADVKPSKRRPS